MRTPVEPVVILGGALLPPEVYLPMRAVIESISGRPAAVVPATARDWAWSVSAAGWGRLLTILDKTVDAALRSEEAEKVILVGHSSGGVVARLFLSPEPFRGRRYAGLEKVLCLVTLGSPHHNRRGSAMRRFVDERYPGPYFSPPVHYVTVAGKSVLGDHRGSWRERLSARSYKALCGRGDEWGDGAVPVSSALIDGAQTLVLPGVHHYSRRRKPWYGSPQPIMEWWKEVADALAAPRPG